MSQATTARAGDSSAPALAVDALHVAWDSTLILHGISFSIPRGQSVALTGANGSGKSTLLRALLGNAPVTKGHIDLLGARTTGGQRPPWDQIGYVPQHASTGGAVSSSCYEVVCSGLLGRHKWWIRPSQRRLALDALDSVGLAHRAHDPLHVLSGGQKQRVLIARALVRRPALLLMDEPMSGIDRNSRERLALALDEAKADGTTILVVLHELGELSPLLDREIHINAGHLLYDGAVRDTRPPESESAKNSSSLEVT